MPSGAANPNTPRWTTPAGVPPPRRYAPAAPDDERMRDPAPPRPEPRPVRPVRPAASRPATESVTPPSGTARSLGAALAAILRRRER